MYPTDRTKRLTILVVLGLFALLAIATTRCAPTVVDENGNVVSSGSNQVVVEEEQPPQAQPEQSSGATWAEIETVAGWTRMTDTELGVVCYKAPSSSDQDCFYLGGR